MKDKIIERKLLFSVRIRKDKQAFGELYDLYVEKVYRFVYFKISNKEEAEDITSEVFLKTWNYLMENTDKELVSFSGLIYRIARNKIIDHYRKKSRTHEVKMNEAVENISGGAMESVEDAHDMEKLMILIKKLKQDYQEVLILKHVEELSISEIAEIVGKSSVGVRVTLHRAMNKLKEMAGGQ